MDKMKNIKKDFPILSRKINGKPLVYLDNAATTQKPQQVIDSLIDFYSNHNANIKRGVHTLGDEATELYENSRQKVATLINARTPQEIIFTKNATESLNIAAFSWGNTNLNEGDVVLTTESEHNSNLLPWMEVCAFKKVKLEFISVDENGKFDLNLLKQKLNDLKPKAFVFAHASNVLGTIFPVKGICKLCKETNTITVIDGSQAIPNMRVDVQSLCCDFYAFSSHKMLGPTGVGVLYGSKELLEKMPPVFYGGGMVKEFDAKNPTWQDVPERFEAGTPDIAGAVGFGSAIDYLNQIGMQKVRGHEIQLTKYAIEKLSQIKNLRILGPLDAEKRIGLVSFVIKGLHSHDTASVLNSEGVEVRSGMHCAMNLHKNLNLPSSTRASFYIYNDFEDIDKLIEGINKAIKILGK